MYSLLWGAIIRVNTVSYKDNIQLISTVEIRFAHSTIQNLCFFVYFCKLCFLPF